MSLPCSEVVQQSLVILCCCILLHLCVAYEDPILVNYAAAGRYNLTKTLGEKVYLPPKPPTFALPEVIDNRVRFAINLPGTTASFTARPTLGLQTPFASSHFYPIYGFTRQASDGGLRIAAENQVIGDLSTGQVTINEMTCQNSGEDLYFRASLSPLKNTDQPIIENAGSSSCKVLKMSNNEYRINFGKDEFWNCGIIDCSADAGKFYCLSLRFPTISGLRLKDDFKVTLQCRAQERIASHTRRINLKAIDTAGRMAPRIAAGGHNSAFDTDIALYRRTFGSEHVFDTKIESGGTVILGEEILLRAAVREGDGWKYSKINEVTVHYVEKRQRNKVTNSLWLLDSEGCLNPQVREICPSEQYRVDPLESYLLFKAFMFENMDENDEMIVTVKVTGCLSGEDCILNCPAGHTRRTRRDIKVQNKNVTFDWQNDIAFKVVPEERRAERLNVSHTAMPYVLACLVLVALVAAVCVIEIFSRKKRHLRT